MAEITAVLLFLGVALAVVTIIGHGIWVVFAALFGSSARQGAEKPSPDRVEGRRACPRCLTPLNRNYEGCAVCGWPSEAGKQTDTEAGLAAVREQLNRYAWLGVVDEATHITLASVIHDQETILTQQKSAAVHAQTTTPTAEPVQSAPSPVLPEPLVELVEIVPPVAPTPTVAQRAEKYAVSRAEAHADPASSVNVEPVAPAVPVSRLLSAFMEEKNIRWGELVGGLLIVGCSIALVISFWSQIATRPLLKFVLLNGVTAALFGMGLYTDRRWKIHTTSHGILIIATLLVPLNFLAIAAFTQASPPTDFLSLAGEAASLIVFSLLVFLAGRVLVPNDAPLLVIAVMVPSLMQLVVRRFAEPTTPLPWLYALAGVPIVSYLATTLLVARKWRTDSHSGTGGPPVASVTAEPAAPLETQAHRALTLLGLASAATLLPLALLAYKVPPLELTLHRLAPLVAVCGLPALVMGLTFLRYRRGVWGRASSSPLSVNSSSADLPAGLQTAGIGIGVLGALIMVGAVVLAWPEPAFLLPTALATAVVMILVAAWFEIPAANVPAGVALAAAWLVGFYLLRGQIQWTLDDPDTMRRILVSATSGHALVPLVAAFGVLAWWLLHNGRRQDGLMYGLVAAATAVASLALVAWYGFGRVGDPHNATWTLALYSITALAAGVALNRADAARTGSALLFAALVQAIVFRFNPEWQLERPWIAALLAHCTLIALGCGALAIVTNRFRQPSVMTTAQRAEVIQSLIWSAQVTSLAAAVWIAATVHRTSAGALSVNLAWLAGVWMLLTVLAASRLLFTLSQIALVLAIMCGVTSALETRAWYVAARHPWLDPWFLEAQGVALAAYCLILGAARGFIERVAKKHTEYAVDVPAPNWLTTSHRLLNPSWPNVDHVLELGLVLLLVAVVTYAVLPGAAQELAPLEVARRGGPAVRVEPPVEQFEIAGIPHRHASDRRAWMLLAAVGGMLAARLGHGRARWRYSGLVLAAFAVCPLLAARWETEAAVASALRWLSAGFLAIGSIAIWATAGWLKSGLQQVSGEPSKSDRSELPREARDLLVALVVLVYVAMGAYVAQAALQRAGAPAASAWLWPYVLFWALAAGVAALVLRRWAATELGAAKARDIDERLHWALPTRDAFLLLALAPLATLLTFTVARALDQFPIVGPHPESWFRRIGWDVSYGVPLVIIALVFIGYAIRDRSSRFAFSAGLLFNVVATIVVLIRLARGGGTLDATAWITVAQVNAIVSGIAALAWLAAITIHNRRSGESLLAPRPSLLITQVVLTAALCATFLVPAVLRLAAEPDSFTWAVAADGLIGWCAVALATAAAFWIHWRRTWSQTGVAVLVAALVALIALSAARRDTGNWLAYHTLLAGCCLAASLLPVATRALNHLIAGNMANSVPMVWSEPAVRFFGLAAVLLAVLGYDNDPEAPWWTLAALAAISARNLWIAWHEARPGVVWIAAILFLPAASIFWLDWADQFSSVTGIGEIGQFAEFLWINVLAAAAIALASVWIERRALQRVAPAAGRWNRGIAFHRFAAWAIIAILLLTTGVGLIADVFGESFQVTMPLAWAACIAAAVTALACWWDPAVRWPVACLYCVGLVAVGIYLDGLNFRAPMFHWALALALAAYSLATSALWSARDRLRTIALRLGIPIATTSGHGWLVSANFLLGVGVLLLVSWIETTMPVLTHRMVAAYAVGAQAFALGLLARGAVRTSLQYLALLWSVLFAVAFGWAWLPPTFPAPWLHRLVVTVVALALTVVVYGFGLVKFLRRENEWTRAAARLMPPLAVLAVALIGVVLAVEVNAYVNSETGEVPIVMPALVAIGLALVGLATAALIAALVPGRDPLGLSERGRTLYIYSAEALAALLFLHIRVTMPWLFRGWFLQFWPLVVMGIAFVGVGLGELFERRRQRVLSEPLHNTGVLLPLLPALGFWIVSSRVDYSLILLSIGALYAAMSVLRQSLLYGVMAAVAANGSLWYFLHKHDGLDFFHHPQLWLIPPALCALVAGYINRERLTQQQSAALRYGAAIVIYVSSTADIAINGVENAPWLPAVLAGLSILGVFAGILLRVRAFLYLGTAFLVVAVMTIIWHAAIHNQRTWILWVAGIVTGALIIALFGLFEKRRDDVLRMVDQLRQWEA